MVTLEIVKLYRSRWERCCRATILAAARFQPLYETMHEERRVYSMYRYILGRYRRERGKKE